jgi:sugar phosphate permease
MQILAEILVQFIQHWILRRFPVVVDGLVLLLAAVGMVAGTASLLAGNTVGGAFFLPGGLAILGALVLSYRERRRPRSDGTNG